MEYKDLTGTTDFLNRFVQVLDKRKSIDLPSQYVVLKDDFLIKGSHNFQTAFFPLFHGHITSLTGPIDEPDIAALNQTAAITILEVLVDTQNHIIADYPEEVALFQDVFNEITILRQSLPILSDAEIKRIKELPDVMGNQMIVADFPKDYRLNFRSEISQAYQDILSGVKSDIQQIADALTSTTNSQDLSSHLQACMASLFKYFANLNLLGFTSTKLGYGEAGDAVALLLSIMKVLPEVSTDKQTVIMNALDPLLKSSATYGGANTPLYQVLAELYCYYVAGELGANNPVLSTAEVNDYIKTTANSLTTSGFTVGPLFQEAMIRIADQNGASSFISGKNLYSQNADESININFSYLQIIITGDRFNGGVINSLTSGTKDANAGIYSRFLGLWQVLTDNDNTTISKLEVAANNLTTYRDQTESELLQSYSSQMKELPLPSAIAFILLDHYMPKEVDYLESLTGTLYYNNLGSKIGNAVLDGIMDFVNGASYFNFASYAGKQPIVGVDGFPGDVDKAKQKIATEKEQVVNYLAECANCQQIIDQQMEAVVADTVLTEFQKTILLNSLKSYEDSLNAIAADLVSVWSILSQLTVIAAVDEQNVTVAGMFNVRGPVTWQRLLEDLETALVSGIVGSPIVSGLFSSQAVIQADQQSFADQGQNDQLDLQMHLTTMQQEWTVVATSLQILNQIYLTLARSILG